MQTTEDMLCKDLQALCKAFTKCSCLRWDGGVRMKRCPWTYQGLLLCNKELFSLNDVLQNDPIIPVYVFIKA